MYCKKCGNEIPDDSVFCLKCGEKVISDEAFMQQPEHEEELKLTSEVTELGDTREQTYFYGQPVENNENTGEDNHITTSEETPRKKKRGLGSVIVLAIIIGIVIFLIDDAKKCQLGSCDSLKIENSEYCKEHTCTVSGCYYPKSSWERFCYEHEQKDTCLYSNCNSSKVSGGQYCTSHTCKKTGCYNKADASTGYCSTHKISEKVDMRKKLTDSSFGFHLNSAGGIVFSFEAKNSSGKEIKYVRFKVALRNAVDDLVKDEIKGTTTVDVEIVGPVKPNARVTMDEKIIGYCETCARIDINDITIVYIDGTSETGRFSYYYKIK